MSELAPTTTKEAFKPARLELVEDPTDLRLEAGEEPTRFEDIHEAHSVADTVNVQHDMLAEARADLEKALTVKNSPLVEKYQQKVMHSEMNLREQLKSTPRVSRIEAAPKKQSAEDYDIAA